MPDHIHGLTEGELAELKARVMAAKESAYCPYSHFRVGAVLLCTDGTWVSGGNVENASYPVGVCAERTALVKAVTEGKRNFRAMAVATDVYPPASSCGMCRQAIREFCSPDMPIFMYDKNGDYITKTLDDLLPMSFGPDCLSPPSQLPRYVEKE